MEMSLSSTAHSVQKFNMTNYGLFYHDTRNLLKNKYAHIMVKNSYLPIPQVHSKKKLYNYCDIKRSDRARQFQYITDQPIKEIIYAVDNNILQNLPIL